MRINKLCKVVRRGESLLEKYGIVVYPKKEKGRNLVYGSLPESLRVVPKDPFDYKLRTREEVEASQLVNPTRIPTEISYEFQYGLEEYNEPLDRFVTATIKIDEIENISKKQMERLLFLCGDRYKKDTREIRIKVGDFAKKEDNLVRLNEIMMELKMETLRAP